MLSNFGNPAHLRRRAFTLVETLVVIAITGILLSLLLMAIQRAREAANVAFCKNHVRQLVLAVHLSSDAYQVCPPANGYYPGAAGQPGTGFGSIFFHLLPFIEFRSLYRDALDAPSNMYLGSGGNLYLCSLPLYACPSDPSLKFDEVQIRLDENLGDGASWQPIGLSSYAYNMQVFGQVDRNGILLSRQGTCQLVKSFPDGMANTIMFVEKYGQCGDRSLDPHAGGNWWDDWIEGQSSRLYDPAFAVSSYLQLGGPPVPGAIGDASMFQWMPNPYLSVQCDYRRPSTPHLAGMQTGMADGSVRTISPNIAPNLWWSACTPAGGEAGIID
jgi:prepilin-type N-terminal cleavage/methylation domain-containing protein